MSGSLAISSQYAGEPTLESRDRMPPEVARLLEAPPGPAADEAWSAFVAAYSGLLLRVSSMFARGYDGTLDRYAFMLDELRRSDCRRLRTFAADGRGRFSTWLAVVARRLCLDHHRQQHGRFRGVVPAGSHRSLTQAARRGLSNLDGAIHDLSKLPAPLPLDPTDELDERDRRAALRHAVELLPPGDQLLLRLRFEEDLTAREMATALGLPSPFHVYRRLDAIYGMVRATLTPGARKTRRASLTSKLPSVAVGRKYPVAAGSVVCARIR
jgi:RNA polymerase sigma factor (sigma-70 family)